MTAIVPFSGGRVQLTETHLQVIQGNQCSQSISLDGISDAVAEVRRSFRHPIAGGVFAAILLVTSVSVVIYILVHDGPLGLLALERFGIALLFGIFFGLLLAFGVLSSRKIVWIRVTWHGTMRLIPLPGAHMEDVDRFLGEMNQRT
jgi:hypothetical protein